MTEQEHSDLLRKIQELGEILERGLVIQEEMAQQMRLVEQASREHAFTLTSFVLWCLLRNVDADRAGLANDLEDVAAVALENDKSFVHAALASIAKTAKNEGFSVS